MKGLQLRDCRQQTYVEQIRRYIHPIQHKFLHPNTNDTYLHRQNEDKNNQNITSNVSVEEIHLKPFITMIA